MAAMTSADRYQSQVRDHPWRDRNVAASTCVEYRRFLSVIIMSDGAQ
jgi:hypothetical protein